MFSYRYRQSFLTALSRIGTYRIGRAVTDVERIFDERHEDGDVIIACWIIDNSNKEREFSIDILWKGRFLPQSGESIVLRGEQLTLRLAEGHPRTWRRHDMLAVRATIEPAMNQLSEKELVDWINNKMLTAKDSNKITFHAYPH